MQRVSVFRARYGLRVRLAILGLVLLAAGAVAAATGALSGAEVGALAARTLPVLGFVVAVSIVAELAADAGLFAWLGQAAVRLARGRAWLLWLLVVILAVVATTFLSLDTTAVLLTPVVVLAAQRAGLPTLPFAMTTVWLANCASLLLPVSNLTNLLAQQRIGSQAEFLRLSVAPAAVCIAVPVLLLALLHRGALAKRFRASAPEPVADRPLFTVAAVVVALLLPALVSGVAVWIPATAAAMVLLIAFAVRRPAVLRRGLLPVGLVLFAAGLFLTVDAASHLGLAAVLAAVGGTGEGAGPLLRLAATGALGANLVDNLPAYLALEPVAGSGPRLIALLVAVNAGPLITPWASLATLLWARRLRSLGEAVAWRPFMLQGALAAVLTVGLGTLTVALLG